MGAPVHNAIVPVDESVIVHLLESGTHRDSALFIQRECFPRPVNGRTHLFYLVHDRIVAFFAN